MLNSLYKHFILFALVVMVSQNGYAKLCPDYTDNQLKTYMTSNGIHQIVPTTGHTPSEIYIPGTRGTHNTNWDPSDDDKVRRYARYVIEYQHHMQAKRCNDSIKGNNLEVDASSHGPFAVDGSPAVVLNGSGPGDATLRPAHILDAPCVGDVLSDNVRSCDCQTHRPAVDPQSCLSHTPLGEDKRYTPDQYFVKFAYDDGRLGAGCAGKWTPEPGYWSEVIPSVSGTEVVFDGTVYNSSHVPTECKSARTSASFIINNLKPTNPIAFTSDKMEAYGFYARREGNNVCIYNKTAGLTQFIDCRDSAISEVADAPQVVQECWGGTGKGQWKLPVTSWVAQCVQETVTSIFEIKYENGIVDRINTPFTVMKTNIRRIVFVTLILYVILIGYKTVLMQSITQKDFVVYVLQISLVLYFSVSDGWNDFYYGIIAGIGELATNMLDAGINTNPLIDYCDFDPALYEAGWGHIRLWDMIDCKLYYYFGMSGDGGTMGDIMGLPKLFAIGLLSIFNFSFVFFIMILFIAVLFTYIIMDMIKNYAASIIAVTILIYVAPIFIPMALFAITREHFTKWREQLIGYSLYPMVLFAFLGILFAIYDDIFWGEGTVIKDFDHITGALTIQCSTLINSAESLGCYLHTLSLENSTGAILMKFIPFVDFGRLFPAVFKVVIFGYLFYKFLGELNNLTSNLVGTRITSGRLMKNPSAGGAIKGMKKKMSSAKNSATGQGKKMVSGKAGGASRGSGPKG